MKTIYGIVLLLLRRVFDEGPVMATAGLVIIVGLMILTFMLGPVYAFVQYGDELILEILAYLALAFTAVLFGKALIFDLAKVMLEEEKERLKEESNDDPIQD